MPSIKYENPAFPEGEEIFVKGLGTLINGQSVEFSDEEVARLESLKGEGAFRKIAHTDRYDEELMKVGTGEETEAEAEVTELVFPTSPEVPATPEGGTE